jgi:hypothetical protein
MDIDVFHLASLFFWTSLVNGLTDFLAAWYKALWEKAVWVVEASVFSRQGSQLIWRIEARAQPLRQHWRTLTKVRWKAS